MGEALGPRRQAVQRCVARGVAEDPLAHRRAVCSQMWPGDAADVTALIPVIDRLHRRFAIARARVVADRGMIRAETMAELEAQRLLYIPGGASARTS